MKELYLLSSKERKKIFEIAAYEDQKSFAVIEKDYWVVWILDQLFSLPNLKSHLTFKGGTSLSKIYKIIDRFSEDIDISIERSFLGFDEKKNPEKLYSKSKQKAFLDDLSQVCSQYIQGPMLSNLKTSIAAKLGADQYWQLTCDPNDLQTLLFKYPSISPKDEYIRSIIKIEMGARAEHWPVSEHKIESYAKTVLKEKINEPEMVVRVLNAERTFWEKATILHQYAHLPEDKVLPARLSRHWYDFFKLLNSEIKQTALKEVALLERVANHKNVYFASAWANYSTARQGTLKLSPLDRVLKELEKDYNLMDAMFFKEKPNWKLILRSIKEFEVEFNSTKKF